MTTKRSELAQVRLTLTEWLRLKDAAKRERKTVSTWLRDMIAKFEADEKPRASNGQKTPPFN